MSSTTTQRRMTASEYYALPEGPPYSQLVRSELIMSPSPVVRHQKVLLLIGRLIGNYLDDHPVGEVMIAPSDVELSEEDVYQPDLYFVSRERLDIFDQQGAKGAPDLVVEILSPSTAKLDRETKCAEYERAGVRELWLVDLRNDQIEVQRFAPGLPANVTILTRGQTLTTPLLPGFKIALAKIMV